MIPDDVIEEVRLRADLVEVIGEHVPLKRAGKEFRALCPFHKEKTPSFYVVPAKGFYKCFGCGEAGDVFTFLMKRQGLGFLEAVRQVAAQAGVEIPEPAAERRPDVHRPLYEAVALALEFYRQRLRDAGGERAREYLARRGIGGDAVERFQLGYAPADWGALREAAHRHGIEDDVLLEAGLVKTSERSPEPYDRLRDRLIFPILDVGGRAIAFGGRLLGPSAANAPKYLNSPETPIYHKGRVLYGLHWSRTAIRREESALVVEGYMDYVALAANGVENVVAPLGTALTPEQATLLARYTGQALLLYDSDMAGLRASFRSADALLRAGVHPLVVTLPQGEDPDSVVREGGATALRPFLDAAVDVIERKLQILEERGYFDGVEGTRKALDGLLPTLRSTADPALRDIYLARIAEQTGVRPETLERELSREASGGGPAPFRRATAGSRGSPPPGPPEREVNWGLAGARTLLLLMLRDERRIAQAAAELDPAEIGDAVSRELYTALIRLGRLPESGGSDLELSPAARQRFEALRSDPEELSEGDRTFADAVNDIRVEGLYRRLDELEAKHSAARTRGDAAGEEAVFKDYYEVAAALKRLRPGAERLMRKRSRAGLAEPPRPD